MDNPKIDFRKIKEANDYVLNSVQDTEWIDIDQAERLWINGVNIILGGEFGE